MSAPAVVVPTEAGKPQPSQAAAVTPMKGGALALTPLPLTGGRKGKRLSKKVLRMFKKGSAKTLRKLMKGGEEEVVAPETPETPATGARRHKKGGRHGSTHRRRGRSGRMYRGIF